jgi:hypothetical protein
MRPPVEGSHSELYREFIDFIRLDVQRERLAANRRLLNVFLWCFLMPALVSIVLLSLVKLGILPRRINHYLDWIIVVFPVSYGIYLFSADALLDLPVAFRRGGLAATLSRAIHEEQWRARVCAEMKSKFFLAPAKAESQGWRWVVDNLEIDLANVQNRTRYLTALAGAVFFIIFQGIDGLDSPNAAPRWSTSTIMGWFEASSSNLTQFVALGIFLMLLYVSGNQIYLSLARYLQCAKLVQKEVESEKV